MMQNAKTSGYQIAFLAILVIYLVFSFSVTRDFGITWDEPSQHFIGQAYSDLIHGRIDHIDFPYGDLKYYGPFFEIINYNFSVSMIDAFRMDPVIAFHILLIITAATGLYFFFRFTSLFFGDRVALFASAFWILHPILFAHSQYNSKEIPVLTGFIIALYLLSRGFFEQKIWWIAGAGAVFGLALATRIDVLFLLPVFFLAYGIFLLFELKTDTQKEWSDRLKKDALSGLAFLGTAVLFLYAAWPALWKNPGFFFEAVRYFLHHGWPGHVLYFGNAYTGSALPWHYALFHFAATTSVIVIALAVYGLVIAFRKISSGESLYAHWLIFFWIFIRLAVGLFPRSVKYDGVRHFMLIIPPMLILAGIGLDNLLKYLEKRFQLAGERKIKTYSGVIFAVFAWLLIEFFWIFPFGGSYYNEIARAAAGPHIEKKFDFEYWGASYRQGMDWLNTNAAPNSSFCVPIAEHLISYYPVRADLSFDCSDKTNYLMFITRWAYYPHEQIDSIMPIQDKNPVYAISKYGSDLLEVYKLK